MRTLRGHRGGGSGGDQLALSPKDKPYDPFAVVPAFHKPLRDATAATA